MRDISFSFSHVALALRCNKLFDLRVLQGLVPDEPEGDARLFGTAIHAGLNDILEGGSGEAFTLIWDTALDMQIEYGRYNWKQLSDMGNVFLARFKRLHAPHLELHYAEQRLYATTDSGLKLEGTPDFVGLYKGVPTLMDFKTASKPYPDGKINAADQQLLYAWLVLKNYNLELKQKAYMVFVKGNEPRIQIQTAPITPGLLSSRMANFEALCRDLLTKETLACNYNACFDYNKRCGFWKQCHKGE